ncbi:MAG: tetratricopeptide repeat protein, partial [Candidatus Heimdallarchaeaceae archaeon]
MAFYDLQIGRLDEAISGFRKSIKYDKRYMTTYDWLIESYMYKYSHEGVSKTLLEKAEVTGSSKDFIKASVAYRENGEYLKSLEIAEKIVYDMGCSDDEVLLNLARNYLRQKKYMEVLRLLRRTDDSNEKDIIKSEALNFLGFHEDAAKTIDEVLKVDQGNMKAWLIKGKIYSDLKLYEDALKSIKSAENINPTNPDIYKLKVVVNKNTGDYAAVKDNLKRAFYYDNRLVKEYIQLQNMKIHGKFEEEFKISGNIVTNYSKNSIIIEKGKIEKVRFKIKGFEVDTELKILKPYGFGVDGEIEWIERKGDDIYGSIIIKGYRSSSVNLGKPWKLVIVYYSLEKKNYNYDILNVDVKDEVEGSVYIVHSEDLENNSEFPHKGDGTEKVEEIDCRETMIDFKRKLELADRLVNAKGYKWTHFIDLGSAFKRLEWVAEQKPGSCWEEAKKRIYEYYKLSMNHGNDFQPHLHLYNYP